MKAITRNEKEVERLAKTLPPLTDAQLKWISRNAVPATAYQFKGTSAWCSNCGHTFDDTRKLGKCPHCGAKFEEHETRFPRKRVSKEKYYTSIITTCSGWQVVRHFMVEHYCWKGGSQEQNIYEAVQVWTNALGEQVINARNVCMCGFYRDVWNFNTPLSIKHKPPMYSFGYNRYHIYSYANKVCRILPILRRNGFDGRLDYVRPDELFQLLLTDNFVETLQKCRQYALLGLYVIHGLDKHLAMTCVRHNYIVKDAKLWEDYIRMSRELGMDIHNPQVCCPADLKAAHDDVMERVTRQRERIRREDERKRAEEQAKRAAAANTSYIKSHKKFFGIMIVGKGITIVPLKTTQEFLEEGKAMHHCVGGYYTKNDSLVLSARDSKGKRLETIEISLKTFEIVQSRGVCNKDSAHHKDIVKLMKEHMGEVMALAQPKRKAKKPARARQAA